MGERKREVQQEPVKPDYLRKVYLPYHSLDPLQAIERMEEELGLEPLQVSERVEEELRRDFDSPTDIARGVRIMHKIRGRSINPKPENPEKQD